LASFISNHHITAFQEFKMGTDVEQKKPRDPAKMITALIVVAIVVAFVAIGYVMYSLGGHGGGTQRTIVSGDKVTLDYIGTLPDGRVFDTSIRSVAYDDADYPKSLTFSLRDNSSYEQFSMTAGNYGSGGTIKGFALGVLGLQEGDRKIIEVAPEDGYALLPQRLNTFNITDKVPITEVMTEAQYAGYFGVSPTKLDVVSHPFWGWNVLVADVSGGTVTIKSQPTVGQGVYPYGNPNTQTDPSGWEIRVIGYDPLADGGVGEITIQNMVSAEDVYHVKGADSSGNAIIIWSFDDFNQTFQVHSSYSDYGYNAEVSGRTLFFEVTIITVEAGSS
jgi:FKBP-type peptidyl-prolyl cis-trans isomerase 2